MLAIHNATPSFSFLRAVANAFAKLSKCQQFTTLHCVSFIKGMLQTLLQSYQNVSNSQLFSDSINQLSGCKRFCKVIKMLAIHNQELQDQLAITVANAFAKLSKCQQFTTLPSCNINHEKLQTLLQSYQNVSNSQLNDTTLTDTTSCKRFCKVIKMLAIHNHSSGVNIAISVANAFAKLSKCQQFTTRKNTKGKGRRLQTLLQSYQNVSNSQQFVGEQPLKLRCKRFCKVIKMLAIHNYVIK